MNEFWLTNSFFVALFSLGYGTLLINWSTFDSASLSARVAISVSLFVLGAVWALTLAKHNATTRMLMTYLREVEERGAPAKVYLRRAARFSRWHWPSIRTVWLVVSLTSLPVGLVLLGISMT